MSSLRDLGQPSVLTGIDLPLPNKREGKVRISYDLSGGRRLFVTTDRLSAFDQLITSIPLKGQVLNQLSWWWFENTRDIINNHALSVPDPNVLIAQEASPLAVEVIVRGHITGVTSTSLWRQYEQGARNIYGYDMPEGLKKNQPLAHAIVTPTTKAEAGQHDEALSCVEVVQRNLVDAVLWDQVQDAALRLFARGQAVAQEAGLMLADTKYEFGTDSDGNLMLIDEVHTPDSSRYWEQSSFDERHVNGQEPISLDKEIIRRAMVDAGYSGNGTPPALSEQVLTETSEKYITAFETLTKTSFVAGDQPIKERIMRNVSHLWEHNNG
jgi:phosphoribosylaminoimidazole-succinocarboxamide synthase